MIRFVWDPVKERANRYKHGVSFDEGRSVFMDSRAVLIADPEHSVDEDRYILLGISWAGRLIVVHHVYREGGSVIRIFSARKATRREMKQYMEKSL